MDTLHSSRSSIGENQKQTQTLNVVNCVWLLDFVLVLKSNVRWVIRIKKSLPKEIRSKWKIEKQKKSLRRRDLSHLYEIRFGQGGPIGYSFR